MKFLMNVLNFILFTVSFSIGDVDKCSSDRYMGNFFPKVGSDYSKIKWAHGVNSKEHLTHALKDDSMMLEADISLGTVEENSDITPIMAHPPAVKSDITLSDWLAMVIKYRAKGIKLDFKSTDVLEPSFQIIKEGYQEMNFPVWINADILPGPVNAPAIPVDPKVFLQLCKLHLPLSTISPGWTTFTNSSVAVEDRKLSWKHVHDMVMVLRDANVTQPVTFPVRAAFIRASMEPLEWLIDAVHDSSLTVWSSLADDVDVNDLLVLRKMLSFRKVYYDLPPFLDKQFRAQKDDLSKVEGETAPYFDKALFTIGEESNSSIIIAARTMVLCGTGLAKFKCPMLNNGLGAEFEIFSAVLEFPDVPGNVGFQSVEFLFGNPGKTVKIVVSMDGEIQFRDNSRVMTIQTKCRKHQLIISGLHGSTSAAEEENGSILVCFQPLFIDSDADDSISPTICQEIKVIRTEQSEPLFTITSPYGGLQVLQDMRSCLDNLDASSAERQSIYLSYLMHVSLSIFIFWLNL